MEATETWMCERHPARAWEHDGCGGAGMLLSESLAILDLISRLSDDGGAVIVTRTEGEPVRVEVVTYNAEHTAADRLPESDWFRYEHDNLLGALVTAASDIWPAARGEVVRP